MTSPHYTFTVFTATYNRADTLSRVYDSLAAQTYRNFEWLICDDGSTDGTRQLVEHWTATAAFPMRYLWQANRGKHMAINRGVQEARGELFLILDSDDACVPQALERFKYHWDRIPAAERVRFSAVTALCMDPRGRLIGSPIPDAPVDSDFIEMRYRVKNRGERWGFHRTAVLREFPFPFADEPAFCPEGLVWSAIARRYKTRYVNEPLRVYHAHERPDQLTARGRGARHGTVLAAWHRCILNEHLAWFPCAPLEFFRSGVHYVRFSLHRGVGLRPALAQLRVPWPRLIGLLALPLGVAVYLRDRATGARQPVPRGDRSKAAGRP